MQEKIRGTAAAVDQRDAKPLQASATHFGFADLPTVG